MGQRAERWRREDGARGPRQGERTAVPGGNRQVVSRQLVSCGGENTKKGLREDIALGPVAGSARLHSEDHIDREENWRVDILEHNADDKCEK